MKNTLVPHGWHRAAGDRPFNAVIAARVRSVVPPRLLRERSSMHSSAGEQGSRSASRDISVTVGQQVESEPSNPRKRHPPPEPVLQSEEWYGLIALEEYLGALDSPAAILLCGTEDHHGQSSLGSPLLSMVASPPRPGYLGAPRPRLVRMSSSNASSWPTTYGSTGSSTGSSTGRMWEKPASSFLPNSSGSGDVATPPNCRFAWGNRYMTSDIEEMLMDELKKDGLLHKVCSSGSSRNARIYTPASRHSSLRRRIAWKVTPIRDGRYLTLIGQEETQDPSARKDGPPPDANAESPKSLPKWLDVPGLSEDARRHTELFVSVDWASTPLGPLEHWCQSLLNMVNICLSSPFPVLLSWGPEMILL